MSGKKRLSGAGFRKRKKEEEEKVKKLPKIYHFFKDTEEVKISEEEASLNTPEEEIEPEILPSCSRSAESQETTTSPADAWTSDLSTDCGEWPSNITQQMRTQLIVRGPEHVRNIKFPLDSQGRKFSTFHYSRKLTNGEAVFRAWLMYSISKNSVFCFPCRIFGNSGSSLANIGYSKWLNLTKILRSHEKSPAHLKNFQSWRELALRLRSEKTIDRENERLIQAETEHWNQVLKRILCVIEFLGSQGLAFRGKNDVIFKNNNGNFLKMIESISKFDSVMAEHVRRITSKETHVHYLSKRIQTELISHLSNQIQDFILQQVAKATYYSIILDCTPDVSHTEQMTMIIRIVQTQKKVSINEYFLGFVPTSYSTGEHLTDCLLEELQKRKLPLKNLRGQGYDNGSNMRGKHAGVQKRILDLNPRAFFVPCGSHSLNLVVNDAALSCSLAVDFFSTVQEIYNFFSASTYRWGILIKHSPSLTVKPLSSTRWESRIDALTTLRYQIDDIYDSAFEASEDKQIDAFGRNTATGITKKLLSFQFICCLISWYEILFKINLVSKHLQNTSCDLESSTSLIKSVQLFLTDLRSDVGFEGVITDAKELAEKLGITPEFAPSSKVRPRRVKKQFAYECEDESIVDPKTHFKVNFFFVILDTAIESLKERFELMESHSQIFNFLYDISKLKSWEKGDILQACIKLQDVLKDGQNRDINGRQLFNELSLFSDILPAGSSPAEALSCIIEKGYVDAFPNIFVSLRILLTIPVSVASGERSFSKLKLIKSYLRSTLSQEQLCDLATLAIEHNILDELDTETILKEFAQMKARKIHFKTD